MGVDDKIKKQQSVKRSSQNNSLITRAACDGKRLWVPCRGRGRTGQGSERHRIIYRSLVISLDLFQPSGHGSQIRVSCGVIGG